MQHAGFTAGLAIMRLSALIALGVLAAAAVPATAARTMQLTSPAQPVESPPVPVGGPYGPPIGLGIFEPDFDYYEMPIDLPASWETLQD